MHFSCLLCRISCNLILWCSGTLPISQPIVAVPLWTSFSQLSQAASLSTVRSSRTHFWNKWLGSVTSLSCRTCVFSHYPVVKPDLATCNSSSTARPFFSPLCFLTTSSTLRFASLTSFGQIRCSLLTVAAPSATNLRQVRTASRTLQFLLFLQAPFAFRFRLLGNPAWLFRSSSSMVRIAPHIPQLDPSQGGFRWGADAMAFSLVDTLRLHRHEHILCRIH